jgi:tyrosinase
MLTRRRFVGATCGFAAGAACAPSAAPAAVRPRGQKPAVRERKDVATLKDASPDVVALKAGVTAMKALPGADLRSWKKQAEIHGQILGGQFNHCQHGNWWFGPWHRAYLYFFEEIVRELSGSEDFALPYWDWSKDFSLPALFWGKGNPLDNPPRQGEQGSGRLVTKDSVIDSTDQRRFVNQTVISGILRPDDFTLFGGDEAAKLGEEPGQGQLEGTPHNFIHRWVGGDMASAGSPYDPIFWLHHCNVDRLWGEWVRRHPDKIPKKNAWLDTAFARHFCDRKGKAVAAASDTVPIKTSLLLDTEAIGYRYDRRPTPAKVKFMAADAWVRTAGPSAQGKDAKFAGSAAVFELRSPAAFGKKAAALVEGNTPQSGTVRLRLKGVKIPENADVAIEVYVNPTKPTKDLRITDASYVTSVTFFHGGHGHEAEGTVSFLVDLTQALSRLYVDRHFSPTEPIKLVLIARPLFPGREKQWKGKIQEITPKEVSIEAAGPKD